MKAFKRIASLALAAILGLSALPVRAESALTQPVLAARVKDIIEADGYQFKDLNDNGQLDPYEDWRLSPQERAENLLSLMTASQKAAQLRSSRTLTSGMRYTASVLRRKRRAAKGWKCFSRVMGPPPPARGPAPRPARQAQRAAAAGPPGLR